MTTRRRNTGIAAAATWLMATLLLLGCAPIDPAPTSTTSGPPTTSEEDLAACKIEHRTLKTAIHAFMAHHQRLPVSIAEVVADGWLEAMPVLEWTYTPDGTSFTLTGPC